jgi:hypothetical protein
MLGLTIDQLLRSSATIAEVLDICLHWAAETVAPPRSVEWMSDELSKSAAICLNSSRRYWFQRPLVGAQHSWICADATEDPRHRRCPATLCVSVAQRETAQVSDTEGETNHLDRHGAAL